MTLGLEISFVGDCHEHVEACRRPRFLNCERIDGFVSFSDAADGTFDTVEVILEGELCPYGNQEMI